MRRILVIRFRVKLERIMNPTKVLELLRSVRIVTVLLMEGESLKRLWRIIYLKLLVLRP